MACVWHRPPHITPNYGKPKSIAHKSNVTHVLLHDNASQTTMLDVKISRLNTDFNRMQRLLALHRKSFLVQQSLKQHQLRTRGIFHLSYLPDGVANGYISAAGLATTLAPCQKEQHSSKNTKLKRSAQNGVKSGNGDDKVSMPMISQRNIRRKSTVANPDIRSSMEILSVDGDVNCNSDAVKSAPLRRVSVKSSRKIFLTHDHQKLRKEKTFGYLGEHGKEIEPQVATEDPRFRCLEDMLSFPSIPSDGFLKLSPSGCDVIEKYGKGQLNTRKLLDRMNTEYGGVDREKYKRARVLPAATEGDPENLVHIPEQDEDENSDISSIIHLL